MNKRLKDYSFQINIEVIIKKDMNQLRNGRWTYDYTRYVGNRQIGYGEVDAYDLTEAKKKIKSLLIKEMYEELNM